MCSNPSSLASLVTVYRDVTFSGVLSDPGTWATAYAVGLITWVAGTMVFARHRETLVESV